MDPILDDFIFSAWGKTTWGNDVELASLDTDLSLIRSNFSSIPLIIGEWAASPVATESAARWRYFDHFLRTAAKYNTSTVLWDNGNDFLDRGKRTWRDATALEILRKTVSGKRNALPESTTDTSATSQTSSAEVWHQYNTSVTHVPLSFNFNNNKLVDITATLASTGKTFKLANASGKDYTLNTASPTAILTLKKSFLEERLGLTSQTAPGALATLTLRFSTGASLLIPVKQFRYPVLERTLYSLPTIAGDLHIPIDWAAIGQTRPATVRATLASGGYLVDDWTQWLGPLQAGRMTYGGQWDWDAQGVIVKASVIEEVRRRGETTTFRIEFYPRREGNWVDVIVSV